MSPNDEDKRGGVLEGASDDMSSDDDSEGQSDTDTESEGETESGTVGGEDETKRRLAPTHVGDAERQAESEDISAVKAAQPLAAHTQARVTDKPKVLVTNPLLKDSATIEEFISHFGVAKIYLTYDAVKAVLHVWNEHDAVWDNFVLTEILKPPVKGTAALNQVKAICEKALTVDDKNAQGNLIVQPNNTDETASQNCYTRLSKLGPGQIAVEDSESGVSVTGAEVFAFYQFNLGWAAHFADVKNNPEMSPEIKQFLDRDDWQEHLMDAINELLSSTEGDTELTPEDLITPEGEANINSLDDLIAVCNIALNECGCGEVMGLDDILHGGNEDVFNRLTCIRDKAVAECDAIKSLIPSG